MKENIIIPNKLQNRPYVGVAVLVIQNNKVLIGERLSHPRANTWQTPGGSLEYCCLRILVKFFKLQSIRIS